MLNDHSNNKRVNEKKKLAFFQTGPVRFETGGLDRLDTELDRFGTKPAGSVSNLSPIRLTNRFDPVWFRTGEPAGYASGFNDF